MPYIEVDIDMDDIETEDLVDEICNRITTYKTRKKLTEDDKKKIRGLLEPLVKELGLSPLEDLKIRTLDDKMKMEHIISIFNKYSINEIQNKLP